MYMINNKPRSITEPFLLDAPLHPLREVEQVTGVAGLGQILQQCVKLCQCAFEVALNVLKLLIGAFIDDLCIHSE